MTKKELREMKSRRRKKKKKKGEEVNIFLVFESEILGDHEDSDLDCEDEGMEGEDLDGEDLFDGAPEALDEAFDDLGRFASDFGELLRRFGGKG